MLGPLPKPARFPRPIHVASPELRGVGAPRAPRLALSADFFDFDFYFFQNGTLLAEKIFQKSVARGIRRGDVYTPTEAIWADPLVIKATLRPVLHLGQFEIAGDGGNSFL